MPPQTSPSEIARETLKTLAARKIAPTPENYTRVYQEISGKPAAASGADKVLAELAQRLAQESPKSAPIGQAMKQAMAANDWARCQAELQQYLFPPNSDLKPVLAWPLLIRDLFKQLETSHKGITVTRKKEGLETVLNKFASDPDVLFEKLHGLFRSWSSAPTTSSHGELAPPAMPEHAASAATPPAVAATAAPGAKIYAEMVAQLRELLAQTLESSIGAQPEMTSEIQALAQQARATDDYDQTIKLAKQLRHFWIKLELHGSDKAKIQEGLVRLLRLLVENVGELASDDKWLHGQIATLQEIIARPIDKRTIADAERNLRGAIIKQGFLKQSLVDAKTTLKSLMTTFIDHLGELTESTGEYHTKIAGYSQKVGSADNIAELSHILNDIMHDTRIIQESAQRSHEELNNTRKQAHDAEERVRQLEQELEQASEMMHEDQLTGALNRRGMDETLDREIKRADRQKAPVSLALLDIDNFKQLNDTLGHQAGDQALVHLTTVIKETVRPTDAVARYGGEEFLVIMPDTGLEEAITSISRLQRELTKKFFLHNNERLLITFSAGVALRGEEEDPAEVIGRADKAMYHAKKTGKNRVVAAD
jgi:diguanylate cyclase